jgi:hypothetical protein
MTDGLGKAWIFMDDRACKVCKTGATLEEDLRMRTLVFDVTKKFDDDVGLSENEPKRQEWTEEGGYFEQLGLVVPVVDEALALFPRAGWPEADVLRVALVPGGAEVREMCMRVFIYPKWLWASPLVRLPQDAATMPVLRAVIRSRCNWWCRARSFLSRVSIHTRAAAAVRILSGKNNVAKCWAYFQAVAEEAEFVSLKPLWQQIDGQLVLRMTSLDLEPRRVAAVQAVAEADGSFDPLQGRRSCCAHVRPC